MLYPLLRATLVLDLLALSGSRPSLALLVDDSPPRVGAISPQPLDVTGSLNQWMSVNYNEIRYVSDTDAVVLQTLAEHLRIGAVEEADRAFRWVRSTLLSALASWRRADRNSLLSEPGLSTFVASIDQKSISHSYRLAVAVQSMCVDQSRVFVFTGYYPRSPAGLSLASASEIMGGRTEWIGSPNPFSVIDSGPSAPRTLVSFSRADESLMLEDLCSRYGAETVLLATASWESDDLLERNTGASSDRVRSRSLERASSARDLYASLFDRPGQRGTSLAVIDRSRVSESAILRALQPLLDRFHLPSALDRLTSLFSNLVESDRGVESHSWYLPDDWRAIISAVLRR